MSVNLSCRQFFQPDLVYQIERILLETGLDARCLRLEITESAIMEHVETALAALARLKALGVRLAIDDFGKGYSSLSYLHQFPFDMLKIDRSFISTDRPQWREHRDRANDRLSGSGSGARGRRRRGSRPSISSPPAKTRLPVRPGLSVLAPADQRRRGGAARPRPGWFERDFSGFRDVVLAQARTSFSSQASQATVP